jgi:hypothetical protein
MGLFMRRRRPVARLAVGAAVAGTAYHMGKKNEAQSQVSDPAQAADAATAPAPAPAAAPANDAIGEVERLAALHQSGALTDEEFTAAKANALGI